MRAIVKAIPKAVPDHFTNRSPMIPRTTGKAAASPNPVSARAKMVSIQDEVKDNNIHPAKAVKEEADNIIFAENFFSKIPTANRPNVKTAIKSVSNPKALESRIFLLSIKYVVSQLFNNDSQPDSKNKISEKMISIPSLNIVPRCLIDIALDCFGKG